MIFSWSQISILLSGFDFSWAVNDSESKASNKASRRFGIIDNARKGSGDFFFFF